MTSSPTSTVDCLLRGARIIEVDSVSILGTSQNSFSHLEEPHTARSIDSNASSAQLLAPVRLVAPKWRRSPGASPATEKFAKSDYKFSNYSTTNHKTSVERHPINTAGRRCKSERSPNIASELSLHHPSHPTSHKSDLGDGNRVSSSNRIARMAEIAKSNTSISDVYLTHSDATIRRVHRQHSKNETTKRSKDLELSAASYTSELSAECTEDVTQYRHPSHSGTMSDLMTSLNCSELDEEMSTGEFFQKEISGRVPLSSDVVMNGLNERRQSNNGVYHTKEWNFVNGGSIGSISNHKSSKTIIRSESPIDSRNQIKRPLSCQMDLTRILRIAKYPIQYTRLSNVKENEQGVGSQTASSIKPIEIPVDLLPQIVHLKGGRMGIDGSGSFFFTFGTSKNLNSECYSAPKSENCDVTGGVNGILKNEPILKPSSNYTPRYPSDCRVFIVECNGSGVRVCTEPSSWDFVNDDVQFCRTEEYHPNIRSVYHD